MTLGRPRTITDEEILAALARAISRVGPARLTLADVAAEAGIAAPTIAQRFGSKRNLLLAFSAQAPQSLAESFATAKASHPAPLAALLSDPLGATRALGSRSELARHLAFLQLELADPEFHPHVLEHARVARQQIRQLLDAAVAQGELRPCDTESLAEAIQVTYNGALLTWAIFGQDRLASWLRRQLEFVLAPFLAAGQAMPAPGPP
ncbi:MAG TPA: TetR/AcrR family transcriptional regulator [Streptosporangiaceae bacterium]